MEQDFIAELEKKINSLIEAYTSVRIERDNLVKDIEEKKNRLEELEGENGNLRSEVQSVKDTSAEQKKKLDTAAGKVKELIARLEAVK